MWNEFKRQVFGSKPKKSTYADRNKGRRERIIKKHKANERKIKKKFGL